MDMNKICVTGADGFIGNALCKYLTDSNKSVRGFVRSLKPFINDDKIEYLKIGDLGSKINLKKHFIGYDCIVHCAGKAHSMNEINDQDAYYSVNSLGTKQLAEQAAEAGIKRLVFLSSIKVNGENTNNKAFTNNDIPNPQDAYSISKFEAEKFLWEISNSSNLEVVVIRLPLVYGYGAKGNMKQLMNLINLGIPLPLSLIKNQRSLIGIDNLVDVIGRCINQVDAAGQVFFVSDDKDLSTPELIKLMAEAMGRSARLFPFPVSILKYFGFIFGKQNQISRLLGSLQVDIQKTKEILNWKPPLSIEKCIKRMIRNQ